MTRSVLLLGLAGAIALAAVVACEVDPRYVYTARKYDAVNGCLTDYKAIERVPGKGVSVRCPEACLTVDDVVYVSSVCPPLPDNAEALDESDPGCQAALDASRMEASCTAPPAEEEEDAESDAGVEEDAEADAAEDG